MSVEEMLSNRQKLVLKVFVLYNVRHTEFLLVYWLKNLIIIWNQGIPYL